MSRLKAETGSYFVEVSGWDNSEKFFVEKAPLEWDGDGGERISMRSKIREGVVIFVRLMQPAMGVTYPMAYQAMRVAAADAKGFQQVTVVQLRPRMRHLCQEATLMRAQPLEN